MADDPTIHWALASPYGILVDEQADAWHSGHVNDVLELPSGALLVGTEKGGVWTVSTSGATVPLSDTWTNPDVNCLVAGPDDPDAHFFAGCGVRRPAAAAVARRGFTMIEEEIVC